MKRSPSGTVATLAILGAGLVLPMIAAHASRKAVGLGYRAITDREPPQNPAAREVDWNDAIVWTLLTGAIGGLARLAVRRALAGTDVPAEGYDFDDRAETLKD